MKNLLFYFIFLLTTINLSAQTYQYHPFIDTTKVWDYYENGTDCITLHDYYLGFAFFKGDTLVDGKMYTKLNYKLCSHYHDALGWDTLNFNISYFGLYREDTIVKKIYVRGSTTEEIFLDFSKNQGDTIFYLPMSDTLIITNIDTIVLPNNFLVKRFHVYSNSIPQNTYFTEYIGTNSFANPFNYQVFGCEHSDGFSLTYLPTFDELTLCNNYLKLAQPQNNKISIDDLINESENSNEYTFSIFDYLGKMHLKTQTLKQSDLNELPKGLYIVHIQKDNIFYSFKFPNL